MFQNTKGLVVCSEHSKKGLGCDKHGEMIAHVSRQLKTHIENYPIHDLELVTVIRC